MKVNVPAADGDTTELLSAAGSWPFSAGNAHVVMVAHVALHLWVGACGVNSTTSQPGAHQKLGVKMLLFDVAKAEQKQELSKR